MRLTRRHKNVDILSGPSLAVYIDGENWQTGSLKGSRKSPNEDKRYDREKKADPSLEKQEWEKNERITMKRCFFFSFFPPVHIPHWAVDMPVSMCEPSVRPYCCLDGLQARSARVSALGETHAEITYIHAQTPGTLWGCQSLGISREESKRWTEEEKKKLYEKQMKRLGLGCSYCCMLQLAS